MAEVEEYEARFERLYRAHAGAVLAYALRRSSSPDDAADAVAETFVVAWRRLSEVTDDEALAWLYGVARKVVSTQRRSRTRQAALAARAATEPSQLAPGPVGGRSPIVRALAELPEDVREVLMLRGWEGLSSQEAAAVLGCSPVAYRIRLHRARGRLRRALSELDGPSAVVQPAARPSVKENYPC